VILVVDGSSLGRHLHRWSTLLRRVASAEVTRAMVGHAAEQMTHHYNHLDETETAAATLSIVGDR
jgi:hypothetical protein